MNLNKRSIAAIVFGSALAGCVAGYAGADQPHMQNALSALNTAKSELQVAEHNKGGHRVKALGYVNDAINETELGISAGD